jgi:PAS domain S-box-containing protein
VSFKRFVLLVDGTADAAFAVDSSGRISAWNRAAAELFGLSEAQVQTVQCHKIFQCSDENGPVCSERCVIERALDNRLQTNFDLRLQTRTGKLWCNLSSLSVNESASGVRHAIYIVRPVEVQKRLEQALSEFLRTQAKIGLSVTSSVPANGINVRLTSREVEVLKSLAKGHRTRTIANQLNISSATVNNHVKHILTKFDVHTRLEAIRHAESVGVI